MEEYSLIGIRKKQFKNFGHRKTGAFPFVVAGIASGGSGAGNFEGKRGGEGATMSNKLALNKKQRNMAELLANPDFNGTITQLCERCDVARSTFYKWMDQPAFRKYLEELIDKFTNSELSTVWKALIRRCAIGDTQAIKLYFELRNQAAGARESGVQIIDDI